MQTNVAEQMIQTLQVVKDEQIAAPIDIVFETILEQMGPNNQTPDGKSLMMTLEPWPGGRWMRDFGNNSGHLWGHVQSIKAPTLLEIYGPLFMSTPATSNLQYRLSEENGVTRLRFAHRMSGWLPDEILDGKDVNKGWTNLLDRVRASAESRGGKR
jgi:uncharacterized protein YndB with AHSA1/START domain